MALDKATLIKGTVGVLGLSGLGVGGYYGIQSLNNQENKESIESKLKAEGFEKLSKTSPEWGNIFKSYQTVSKTNTVLKFAGNEITNATELQERCEEILNKSASEDNETNNYSPKTKKWCIVPTTVSDGLKGRKILGTDNIKDGTEHQQEWNQKIKDYTKQGNSNKIKDLNYSGTPIENPNEDNRNLIRGACKKLNEMKSYEEDYETAINNSRDWCTLPQ